jgi:deoxyribonuclease-1
MKSGEVWGAILLITSGLAAIPAIATERDPFDFDTVVLDTFWSALYPAGGYTLYCGFKFGPDRRTPDRRIIGIDHIYPTARIIRHLGCRSRMDCKERHGAKFTRMEADLHNLYPVWQPLVTLRNSAVFGDLPGADWRFDDCEVKWRNGVFDARPIARGNIARAIFHMHSTWGLPLAPERASVLRQWNRDDPPSRQEQMRNDQIERLQGLRNVYIDDPALAERLVE